MKIIDLGYIRKQNISRNYFAFRNPVAVKKNTWVLTSQLEPLKHRVYEWMKKNRGFKKLENKTLPFT
jgi:hypothetical protein